MPAKVKHQNFVILRDPDGLSQLRGAVVAIGNFDGLHRGHKEVISRAKALAHRLGRLAAALTFEPHPADFFAGGSVVFRLTPERAKALTLARLGLDGMIVITFDAALASLTAEQFVTDILVRRLGVSGVVVGYDFHFGKARQGSPEFLVEAGQRHGFAVEVVEKVAGEEAGDPLQFNSTATREALEQGDVATAQRLLGHPYFIVGDVVSGAQRGRNLGFPTANILTEPTCRLRHGIYAVRIHFDDRIYDGVANYGRRPTFDNGAALLEVYVFDFSGDLYGKTMEVDFVAWVRGEEKFASAEALVAEIKRDVERARALLAEAEP